MFVRTAVLLGAYAVGCYAAYRLGKLNGIDEGAKVFNVSFKNDLVRLRECEIDRATKEIFEIEERLQRLDADEGVFANLKGAAREALYMDLNKKIADLQAHLIHLTVPSS